jgi:hypothetical protein
MGEGNDTHTHTHIVRACDPTLYLYHSADYIDALEPHLSATNDH